MQGLMSCAAHPNQHSSIITNSPGRDTQGCTVLQIAVFSSLLSLAASVYAISYTDIPAHLYCQCVGQLVGLSIISAQLLGKGIANKSKPPALPTFYLNPSQPTKPFGYYRRRRRVKHYHLYRRVLRRKVKRPIRDAPRKFLNPLTWKWCRRTPLQSVDSKQRVGQGTGKPPCHRKCKRKRVKPLRYAHLTLDEQAQQRRCDFQQQLPQFVHKTDIMYGLQYGVSLDEFVARINPLQQFQTQQALNSPEFLRACGSFQAVLEGISIRPFTGVAMLLKHNSRQSSEFETLTDKMERAYHSSGEEKRELPVVIDTGASTSVTPVLSDFIGPLEPTSIEEIRGISSSTRVVGKGTVEWTVQDYWNVVRVIRTTAYYVPAISIRLFSPQAYFQENGEKGQCTFRGRTTTLELPDGSRLEFPYNSASNLPNMLLDPHPVVAGAQYCDATFLAHTPSYQTLMSVTEQTNQNLRPSQRELLLLHHKLGHAGFQWCQKLCQVPRDPTKEQIITPKTQHVTTCEAPLCTACQLAKQNRRTPDRRATGHPEPMLIRQGNLSPGDCVSIDQYISALPGRLPHTKGKESKSERYNGGTIFIDHASTFMYLRHQVSLTSGETLRSKKQFENYADQFGVKIQRYRADNVPFSSAAFLQNVKDNNQSIDFSGTGAHHQNGVAERSIQTVTRWARAMLLHAVIMWPDRADLSLWPFAMEHAIYLWNNMPKQDSRTAPLEIFTRTRFPSYEHLRRLHVWGCPAYVLDPKLQDGKQLPKWHPRSRRGQFLGVSPSHSSTIGRILNLTTGYISPQYHVVYDDQFTTVPNAESGGIFQNEAPFNADVWDSIVRSGLEHIFDPELPQQPELHDDWLTPTERQHRTARRKAHRDQQTAPTPPVAAPEGENEERDGDQNGPAPLEGAIEEQIVPAPAIPPAPDPPVQETTTRSGRQVKRPQRLIETMVAAFHGGSDQEPNAYRNPKRKIRAEGLNQQFLMALQWNQLVETLQSADLRAMMNLLEQHTDLENNTVEWMHPMILAAKANAEDNPTWDQAMNGPDRSGYWEAMAKELKTLQDNKDAWDVVDRESWMNVLPSTWAFKCKRYPDGSVRKLKARFCARGDRQIEGVDFFDTFAPVVNWTTVRLMLILSIILGLSTRQVDYTAAFVHAPIDHDPNWDNMTEDERERAGVYLEMPRGFSQPGKVLKLKRSLYGLRQSPRNFFQHLKSKLEGIGFESNESVDPCLFISDNVICLVYVDDTLLFSPNEKYIDEVVAKLSASEMELEEEDSVAGFLGVHLERNDKDGSIKLTQQGLSKRIVDALNLGNQPRKLTPATPDPLVKDDGGEPANGAYNYASVIGMMQYLQGHSRPDITYAVSQCARFIHSPKRSHEIALERIGLYLKGTLDQGLILRPSGELDIDVFVDADFAGLWPHEDKHDPTCVKSRSGFVICISNCPVIWVSKLQHEIALSTMEAEYNALSYSMRSVLPFQQAVKVIARGVGLSEDRVTSFRTTVWEDNTGALTLANLESGRITPRSKHYAIKYHWFRSHLKPNQVDVKKIDSCNQKADILTKGLKTVTFQNIRKLLCGW
jgi:Reverse transcriptase (RNA-dependent DNA polymerase)